MTKKSENGVTERIRILERAAANLGDAIKRHGYEIDEDIRDILRELKAIKLFLSRNMPEFKKQFPEIQRKLK
jgi:protein-arginine kinase activator protein McsA